MSRCFHTAWRLIGSVPASSVAVAAPPPDLHLLDDAAARLAGPLEDRLAALAQVDAGRLGEPLGELESDDAEKDVGGFQGQSTDVEIHARETLFLRRRTEEILARHSGQDVDKVHRDCERDYFMSAAEARDYGLIDTSIESNGHAPLLTAPRP